MSLSESFPEKGSTYQGGKSDGWEYRIVFAGGTYDNSLTMIARFLEEEGFGHLPLPSNAKELKLFRFQKWNQIQLFKEKGYAHNPIKILFPAVGTEKRGALILYVYNKLVDGHLLRFHGLEGKVGKAEKQK